MIEYTGGYKKVAIVIKENMKCSYCKHEAPFNREGGYKYEEPSSAESIKRNGYHQTPPFDAATLEYLDINEWVLLSCGNCKQPILVHEFRIVMRIQVYGRMDELIPSDKILEKTQELIYPHDDTVSFLPNPSGDMPLEIINDYNEARNVFEQSPRASAALLRLAIQKLCIHLGKPGKNINEDIASLVKDGLPMKIQQALDVVRVIGNNAVHPGTLDLQDDPQTVLSLFRIVNFIVESMITYPKEVEEIYNKLPETSRKSIEERNRKN